MNEQDMGRCLCCGMCSWECGHAYSFHCIRLIPPCVNAASASPIAPQGIDAYNVWKARKVVEPAPDAAVASTHAYYRKKIADAEAGTLDPRVVPMFSQLAAALGAGPVARPERPCDNPPLEKHRRMTWWTMTWWTVSAVLAAASIVALAWPWPEAVQQFLEGILR